jgi:hypothetical protein
LQRTWIDVLPVGGLLYLLDRVGCLYLGLDGADHWK